MNVYSAKVPTSDRENMLNYGLAMFHGAKGDFKSAVIYIKNIHTQDIGIKTDIYTLKIRHYFDLENPQTAINELRSFRQLLTRSRILSEERKEVFFRFVEDVGQLVKFKEGKSIKLQQIKDRITTSKYSLNEKWLLEKIEELTNQR